MKVGHRLIKIGLLTLATALIVTFTVSAIPVSIGAFSMILIIIASIAFLFTPAYLESRLKRRDALSEANANPTRGSESGGGGDSLVQQHTVAVVVDSCSCIPSELVHNLPLFVAPHELAVDGHSFLDGVDINPDEF